MVSEDRHSSVYKTAEKYFTSKDTFDLWQEEHLPDIKIPFIWPHPTIFKTHQEANESKSKYGSPPNNSFFLNNHIQIPLVYKTLFDTEYIKPKYGNYIWFNLELESLVTTM